jgi:hypothetical protein
MKWNLLQLYINKLRKWAVLKGNNATSLQKHFSDYHPHPGQDAGMCQNFVNFVHISIL